MEIEQVVARIKAGEDSAENMLILWQMSERYIDKIIARHTGLAEPEDMKQEAYISLYDAVDKYDIDSGVPFLKYAAYWVNTRLKRYIESCGRVVRLPAYMSELVRKYRKHTSEYERTHGVRPSDREISKFLCVGRETLERIKKATEVTQLDSLNAPIPGVDDLTLIDTVASGEDMAEDAERTIDRERLRQDVQEILDNMPATARQITINRYLEGRTRKESAEMNGISIERTRQEERRAMRILGLPKNSEKLRGYYEQYIAPTSIHHVGLKTFKTTWTSSTEREALRI